MPECVIFEIENRMADAVKHGEIKKFRELLDCLAWLSLKELLYMKSSIYPSSWPCDIAIPKIDPLLLDGKAIITGDDGAYRRWLGSPISRIAEIYKVNYDLSNIVSTTHIARLYCSTITRPFRSS